MSLSTTKENNGYNHHHGRVLLLQKHQQKYQQLEDWVAERVVNKLTSISCL